MTAPKLRLAGFKEPWNSGVVSRLLVERKELAPQSKQYPLMAFVAYKGVASKGDRYDRSSLVKDVAGKLYKRTEKGDFIYSSNNLETGSIGLNKYGKACISPVYGIFCPTCDSDSEYIGVALCRKKFIQEMVKWRQGVVYGQWRIHEDDFLGIPVPFPDGDEQRAMGCYFASLDRLIDAEVLRLESLRKLKVACLGKMFVQGGECCPKLRLEGFTGNWVKKVLGECGNTYNGLNGKTKSDFGHGNAAYVPYVNVYQNAIADVNLLDRIEIDSSQNEVRKGDVLFTTSSETPDEVGLTSVWLGDASNVYLNSFCFGYRPNVKFDQWFLANVLRADDFRRQMYVLAQGISRYNISKTSVMNLSFYAPPTIEEQQAIGVVFRNLEEAMTLQVKKIERIRHMKSACMERMFV